MKFIFNALKKEIKASTVEKPVAKSEKEDRSKQDKVAEKSNINVKNTFFSDVMISSL